MSSESSGSNVLGALCMFTAIILTACNLLGYTAISWWVVLGIAVAPFVIGFVFLLVFGLLAGIVVMFSGSGNKRR